MLLTQDGKRRLAQAKTCEVFVSRDGGRARPAVEKRKLTKNCAGRKGHKPNALVIVPKMNTRPASGDEIKGRPEIAVPKDDMTGRPGHRLQPNTRPFDLYTTAESASTSATVTASRGATARRTRTSSQRGSRVIASATASTSCGMRRAA